MIIVGADAESEKHSLVETIAKAVPSHNLAGRDFRCNRRSYRHPSWCNNHSRPTRWKLCPLWRWQWDRVTPLYADVVAIRRYEADQSVRNQLHLWPSELCRRYTKPLPNWSPIFREAEGVAEEERVSCRGLTKICRENIFGQKTSVESPT